MIENEGIENAKKVLEKLEKSFYSAILMKTDIITHISSYLNMSRSTLRKIFQKYDLS